MEYELLRFITAFMTGFIFSTSGSLLQWWTQNPLADPTTMGITVPAMVLWLISSSLVSLGLISDFYSGPILLFIYLSLLTLIHIFFANFFYKKKVLVENTILMGVAANLALAAIFSLLQFLFMIQGKQLPSQILVAHFKFINSEQVFLLLFLFLCVIIPSLWNLTKKLQLLLFGKEFLNGMLPAWKDWEKWVFLYLLFVSGVAIFLGGNFSFWGLIMPHFLRKFTIFKINLWKECIIGGFLAGLLLSSLDWICYSYPIFGAEIPVGSVTAVLGPILLIYILKKRLIS